MVASNALAVPNVIDTNSNKVEVRIYGTKRIHISSESTVL